ncbi:YgaP family membrane protein [Magnetospirillum fulvum]|uniref:Inner membrane protein YgaP-like transmembrane domain-containing protein n=1 Tax=Magnetospirillum fulvum TaxID=1082 RepID=A0A1H6HYW3_MAGFU|nr:DUF2892 domain-containing protein [Magnetospirillum fulvum]SEH40297.1 Protein of unknown function [Magnetospirillum fulvum]
MTPNVGGLDRIIRISVGIALIVATLTGFIGVWGWIGVAPLLGGLVGWCPAYTLLGISTCKSA